LMAAVALEGLSPEASLAALQQLNYDLTMQVGSRRAWDARMQLWLHAATCAWQALSIPWLHCRLCH
jgi:hypothetical protein